MEGDASNTPALGEMERGRGLTEYSGEFGFSEVEFVDWLNKFSIVGDIGSGEGKLVNEVKNNSAIKAKVIGVDIDPRGGNGLVAQGRGEKLPLGSNSLDAVISSSAMMFYGESKDSLKLQSGELARVVKPGGGLAITLMSGEVPKNDKQALKTKQFSVYKPDRSGVYYENTVGVLETAGFTEIDRKISKKNRDIVAIFFKRNN